MWAHQYGPSHSLIRSGSEELPPAGALDVVDVTAPADETPSFGADAASSPPGATGILALLSVESEKSASPLVKRLPVSPSLGCVPETPVDEDAPGACDDAELLVLDGALSFFPRQAHEKTTRANRIKSKQHRFNRIITSHPPYADVTIQ